MSAPTLFDYAETLEGRPVSLQARFEEFHKANPLVYELLVRFARQLKATGREHCGIKLVWERMRWEIAMTTRDPEGFKLNNNYHSRYARLVMAQEPDLAEFFHTRQLTAL